MYKYYIPIKQILQKYLCKKSKQIIKKKYKNYNTPAIERVAN